MVFITINLIRKRSEHNEGEIGTLEEISLHQENIEKIEHLGQWCRHLKILLLQSNLISKIENLNKLKELEYLNLAINNIEKIENLEKCESLQKLDLTLNFIGDLTSVASLKNNIHLRELYLTGNPCTDYIDYRKYVIAVLPQITTLDNKEITTSEKIIAHQEFKKVEEIIKDQQEEYAETRAIQKKRMEQWVKENEVYDKDNLQENETFWKSSCEHSPESRILIAKRSQREHPVFGGVDKPKEPKKPRKLFTDEGKPRNINEANIPFKFVIDDPEKYTLELEIYKYLDTELLSVDVGVNYVRVLIKGKIFQLSLNEEVKSDQSIVQRSKVTGHLTITMPILNPDTKRIKKWKNHKNYIEGIKSKEKPIVFKQEQISKREYLEIGAADSSLDFSNIIKRNELVDDLEVPPLE